MFNVIFCQWLDLNCGPLELEATALPTEPQPLPQNLRYTIIIVWTKQFCNYFADFEKEHYHFDKYLRAVQN